MDENSEKPQPQDDYEANQNLTGFFELLLKVDKRLHPELYKPITENSDAEL
jgi:hypothetical protein